METFFLKIHLYDTQNLPLKVGCEMCVSKHFTSNLELWSDVQCSHNK